MRFVNQFNEHSLRFPSCHMKHKIATLIDKGLITDVNESGFPLFTPIGTLILENIKGIFSTQIEDYDFNKVSLPTAMETKFLLQGEKVGEQFKSKIMHLQGSLDGHHVISSPETLFVQWGRRGQLSYKQLPIRYYYTDNLHRQKTNGKGALFPQQINIFGGISAVTKGGADKEISVLNTMAAESFKYLGLKFHQEDGETGFNHEYFYICDRQDLPLEGENLPLPSYDPEKRTRTYSLGMIYHYQMPQQNNMRYKAQDNKNQTPELVSFGICPPRILHCLMHQHHDDLGFNLPAAVRPFDISLIPESNRYTDKVNTIYMKLKHRGPHGVAASAFRSVSLDERYSMSTRQRLEFSKYLGTPLTILVKDFEQDTSYVVIKRGQDESTNSFRTMSEAISFSKNMLVDRQPVASLIL